MLSFNSTSFTLRRIICKIYIKENLKFSFSSQKRNKPEVSAIKNKCYGASKKKKKKKKKKCRAENSLPKKSWKLRGLMNT